MTLSCALVWAAVLITLPVILLLWATESKSTRIRRLRRNGHTWRSVADRYGVSVSTVRRWAAA